MIETILRLRFGPCIVHQIDIQSAVAVKIEEGPTGAHLLRHVVSTGRSAIVREIEAYLLGDILKPVGALVDGMLDVYRG
jgi:hypothetical protein